MELMHTATGCLRSRRRGPSALLWVSVCVPLLGGVLSRPAQAAPGARAATRTRRVWRSVSPNRKHRVECSVRGLVRLDGHPIVRLGSAWRPGGLVARWRADSQAVALLRRRATGRFVLHIIPEVSAPRSSSPLVWRVPARIDYRPRLTWLGRQEVALGPRVLSPKISFSWVTELALR